MAPCDSPYHIVHYSVDTVDNVCDADPVTCRGHGRVTGLPESR